MDKDFVDGVEFKEALQYTMETVLVGMMMCDPSTIPFVVSRIGAECIADEMIRDIFRELSRLHREKTPFTEDVALKNLVKKGYERDALECFMLECMENAGTKEQSELVVSQLECFWIGRRMMEAAEQLIRTVAPDCLTKAQLRDALKTFIAYVNDTSGQPEPFSYETYLKSPEWKQKRDERVKAAGGRCQVCNSPKRLDCHHRTYERIGDELPDDLFVLCRPCHDLFHKNGRLAKP